MRFLVLMALAVQLSTAPALAQVQCPSRIYYDNGTTMKSSSGAFYYRNGSILRTSGGTAYYSTGTTLLGSSGRAFYPNGNALTSSSNGIYYPNGQVLRTSSGAYFYANGGSLRSSSGSFYYRSGQIARTANGTLYREDGTRTEWPITLTEEIENYGTLAITIRSNSETLALHFHCAEMFASAPEVLQCETLWTQNNIDGFRITINSGRPNENIRLEMRKDSFTCELLGTEVPSEFSLNTRPASVQVRVNAGYDPARVRAVLEAALNDISTKE